MVAKALEVRGLDVYRGGVQVLRSVDLDAERGQVVLIAGRNGAGKTTLIKSIIGLLSVKQGVIRLFGDDITNLPTHERILRGIAYSPEAFEVFTNLTVEENVRIGRWSLGLRDDEDHFKTVVEIFKELKYLLPRRALHLSGGERRMVSIARAFYMKPQLMLLDEPLEGLAPVAVERLNGVLRGIKEQGISMVIAESTFFYINKLMSSAIPDKVYVIERGEIIFEGRPEELMQHEAIKTIRGY